MEREEGEKKARREVVLFALLRRKSVTALRVMLMVRGDQGLMVIMF